MTRRDRGATSLEYVGVTVLIGIIIAAIVTATSPTRVGEAMRHALCNIFVAAGVSCDAGTVDPHVPTEPCVISQDGWGGTLGISAGVSGGTDISVVTERLSNGNYRVTVDRGGKIGVETGVGWDLRVEANGSSYGHDANAGAEAHLGLGSAEVYVVQSEDEAATIESWAVYQQARDATVGNSPLLGPIYSSVSDQMAEWLGLQRPPVPAATVHYGGLSADASAHLTTYALMGLDAQGGFGTMRGYTQFADGSTEVVTQINGTLQASASAATAYGQIGGTGTMYTEETYDAKGNRTGITLNYTSEGADEHSITSYHLPLTTQERQDAATRLMWDPTYFGGFMELAEEQGQMNRVTYDKNGWDGALNLSGKLMGKVGVEVTAEGVQNEVRSAEYWDGNQWVPWSACS